MRRIRAPVALLAGMAIVAWPWVLPVPLPIVNDATRALLYALVATSLVLLTGWVGQISLAQGSFVGIGAIITAVASERFGIPFPLSLPVAVAAGTATATVLGVVALRVRGLYLAVATLIFAWMADAWLFPASWFIGQSGSAALKIEPVGRPGTFVSFDLHNPKVWYVILLAALALAVYAVANLRDSKTGRAFFAIRGSEMAASSLGINVTRYKLLAFGMAGAIAGLAGHLQMGWQGSVVPAEFNFLTSLFYLSVAVVGGLTSLPGVIAAGVLFSAVNEVFFRVQALNGYIDLVSALLLLTVLLVYPGGLASAGRSMIRRFTAFGQRVPRFLAAFRLAARAVVAIGSGIRVLMGPAAGVILPLLARALRVLWLPFARFSGRVLSRPARRYRSLKKQRLALLDQSLLVEVAEGETASEGSPNGWAKTLVRLRDASSGKGSEGERSELEPVLEAEGVTVRFGGLVAVDSFSMNGRDGEIVGLIGPNGAGKTTLFNAIAGFNRPVAGSIRLFGIDVTGLPVHERAALGVGRTFQLIQLFPHLDVFGNVLVGTHVLNPTGFLQHLAVTARALAYDTAARRRAQEIIKLLDLAEVADRRIGELPFGILRIVELARALATGSPFLMLDEPASGLDSTETGRLAELLRLIRAELGLTILLIEHDVSLVTSVSDYIYVIDQGKLLAEGQPEQVQRNEEVIAAYLGRPEPVGVVA